MTIDKVLASVANGHFRVDSDTAKMRSVKYLLRSGMCTIETSWKTLAEWDGGFLGYHYPQSVRFDMLRMTDVGRTHWLAGTLL